MKFQVIIEQRFFYRVNVDAPNEIEAGRIAQLNTDWLESEPIHNDAHIYDIIEEPKKAEASDAQGE